MIVGIDVSSKQINLAWMIDGNPCRWSQKLGSGALIDRLRRIHIEWPGEDIQEVVIEMPFSNKKNAISALMATVGVITHQAPSYARVSWISTGDLRRAMGCKNTKDAAHAALGRIVISEQWTHVWNWSPDDLDALVACIGWTQILQQQDAA